MGNVSSDSIIRQFEDKGIRAVWVPEEEEWYFAIVDVVNALVDSDNPQTYWRVLKKRLIDEGNETVTNCNGLKMRAADGKMRKTDAATTEQLLRIIQSVPSKKAEPFKLWLARVGRERIEETIDPEIAMQRAIATCQKKGYDEGWIRQRLFAIDIRKELTNEWRERGVRGGKELAILTDEVSKAWSGMTTLQYKDFKGLTKESLRDNMSNTELVLNMLAETTATEISRAEQPEGFEESKEVARRGGAVAGQARKAIETETGKPVVTSMNALDFVNTFTGLLQAGTELIDVEE